MASMMYQFAFEGMPEHAYHRQADHLDKIWIGDEPVPLLYEPAKRLVRAQASRVAIARLAVGDFYMLGKPWPECPASYTPMEYLAPPPPDWPTGEPAAACPECNGAGRVMLFAGYSPCSLCSRPAAAVE